MSPSERSSRATGLLQASAAPGVEIEVVDADFQIKARGMGKLEVRLPEGIYMVNAIASGHTQETLVRLLPDDKPLKVKLRAPKGLAETVAGTAGKLNLASQPKHSPEEGEVVVIIQSTTAGAGKRPNVELRLLNRRDVAMRSNGRSVKALQEETSRGQAARVYAVREGLYRLQYVSPYGETMQQGVPVLAGRRTIVVLAATVGEVLASGEGAFQRITYFGVDASKTVMVTTPLAETVAQAGEALRLAEILLHDLAVGRAALGDDLVERLSQPEGCPLLKLYGAVLIVHHLATARLPSPGLPWSPDSSKDKAVARWRRLARGWLKDIEARALAADITPAIWRLARFGATGRSNVRATLPDPPLLERCWVWAAVHSVGDVRAVPPRVAFKGAVRGASGASPWLAWRAAAGKGPAFAATSKPGQLFSLIQKVEHRLQGLKGRDLRYDPDGGGSLADDLHLSPESRTLALRTAAAVSFARAVLIGDPLELAAEHLAMEMAAPACVLVQKLQQLLNELDAGRGPERPSSARKAPGLRRQITYPDDPQKSRFGGVATRGGFALQATFHPTRSRDWVAITLEVQAPAGVRVESATFYLHDSYDPDRHQVPFANGRAALDVIAWGGFTVGAWVAEAGVELELDLAEAPGAPRVIREL